TAPPVTVHSGGFGPPPSHPATAGGGTGPKRTVPSSSSHPDQSQPSEPPVLAGKCKNPTGFNPNFKELVLSHFFSKFDESCDRERSDRLAWRRLSGVETDPIRGVGCTGVWGDIRISMVEILGNVPFIGETLPKFRQKVSVFSKWARHRGDVRNSKGFVPGFGKIRGGNYDVEYQKILLLQHRRSSLPTPEKQWQPPRLGCFKLNVDGALRLTSGLHGLAS
ncbi:AP2/B3-like transcriptional factor family protein, partial [Prunus dulcis]